MLETHARQVTRISSRPVYVLRELVDLLRRERVVLPGYTFLQRYRRFNRITVSIAATIPLEEAHEQAHGEACWGENRRRNVRNARSRNGLRIIGEGNAQDRPASPVDLGDGEGGYHCTRWSNSTSGSGWASGSSS